MRTTDKLLALAEAKAEYQTWHVTRACVVADGENHYILDPSPDRNGPVFRIGRESVRLGDESKQLAESRDNQLQELLVRVDSPVTRVEHGRLEASSLFSDALFRPLRASTQSWSWGTVHPHFGDSGCSELQCPYHRSSGTPAGINFCALNLSDVFIRSGYTLLQASDVQYCQHGRVRNADGMARVVRAQNGGAIDASGWQNRPTWNGIVFFEGGPDLTNVTGHIDLYKGATQSAIHAEYPNASTVWFWKLGS